MIKFVLGINSYEKINLLGTLLTTAALTACGGLSFPSDPTSSVLNIDDAFYSTESNDAKVLGKHDDESR